jgi:hypothetical protein
MRTNKKKSPVETTIPWEFARFFSKSSPRDFLMRAPEEMTGKAAGIALNVISFFFRIGMKHFLHSFRL